MEIIVPSKPETIEVIVETRNDSDKIPQTGKEKGYCE